MLLVFSMSALVSGPIHPNPPPARFGDFGAYWVSARCLIEGRDAYDQHEVETVASRDGVHQAFVTWNPPWSLLLFAPLGLLPFDAAALVWAAINVAMAVSVAVLWGRRSGLSTFAATVLAITFVPVGVCVGFSQLSILVLASTVGYWVLLHAGHPFWAGTALLGATIKPHLVSVVWLVLLLHGPLRNRIYSWLGLGAALSVSVGGMMLWRPENLPNYLDAVWNPPSSSPTNYASATVPAWLQWVVESAWNDGSGDHVRFHSIAYLPLLAAAPFLAQYVSRGPSDDRVFESSLVLSILLLPYGWHYDQVLLLPGYLSLCGTISAARPVIPVTLLLAGLLAFEVGGAAMLVLRAPERFFFVWPLLLGIAWIWRLVPERRGRMAKMRS